MNERKAYTVAIGNLPIIHNKKIKNLMKEISECDGFIGVHPVYPKGTLLLFDSELNALKCKNYLEYLKVEPIGVNIGECFIPE